MKSFLILLLAFAGSSAFASKARVNSLLGDAHLIDSQTAFTAPSHILELDPFLTFEMGAAGSAAEGGALQELDNGGKLYLYLGHQNSTASTAGADLRASTGYLTQNNPIEVLYGMDDMAYGASLSYVDNDKSNTKETTIVLKWGKQMDESWMYAHAHLLSNAEKAGAGGQDEMKVNYITFGANWVLEDDNRVYGDIDFGASKEELASGGSTDYDDLNIMVGYENRSLKTDKADIYYGIAVMYDKRDVESANINIYQVPAYLGIEYMASDWGTLRVSLAQNILLGQDVDETELPSTDDADGIAPNTTVAAGLGLKYKDVVLDGSLTAATTGNVNGSSFLSQASLTYFF